MEEIKFWYAKRNPDFNLTKFKREYFGEEENKFVQLYINQKPVIVTGHDLYHRNLVELCLNKFDIKFETRKNRSNALVPLEEGENYILVGAGRVRLFDDTLNFYDNSQDYHELIKGTNSKNLVDIFGEYNVLQIIGHTSPFFLVEMNSNF